MHSRRLALVSCSCLLWSVAGAFLAYPLPQQGNDQTQSGQYDDLVAQAKADLGAGNPSKALVEAQQAERLDSKRWEAYFMAGTAQQTQKMCDGAHDSFVQALARAPGEVEGLINNVLQEGCTQQQPTVSVGNIHGSVINPTGQPQGGGTVSLSSDGGVTSSYTFPVSNTGQYSGQALPGTYMLIYRAADTPPGKMVDSIRAVNIVAREDIAQDDDMSRQEFIGRMSPEQQRQLEAIKEANAGALRANAVINQLNADLRAVGQDKKEIDGAFAIATQTLGPSTSQSEINAKADEIKTARYTDIEGLMTKDTGIKPDEPLLLVNLGYGQAGLKKYDQAIASYTKAIEMAAKNPRGAGLLGIANAGLGEVYARQGRVAEANAAYAAAAETDPANAAIHLKNQAIIFFQQNNGPAQVAAADMAIKIDPNDAVLFYIKGQGLIQSATVDKRTNRVLLPNGCAEAYQEYLALAPNGTYAQQVRLILQGASH